MEFAYNMKRKLIIRSFVNVAVLCGALTLGAQCLDSSGSTTCGGGTGNFLVYCSLTNPLSNCTGSGNPVPETDLGSGAKGKMDWSYGAGTCTWTVYFVNCCGGAVTQDTVVSGYIYDYPSGGPCPTG